MPRSVIIKRYSFILCVAISLICMLCIIQFSGFRHESKKFKHVLVSILVAILSRYVLWEHVEFAVKSLFLAVVKEGNRFRVNSLSYGQMNSELQYKPLEYLKRHLKSFQEEFQLNVKHKDESLNQEYRSIVKDLWLFGKYFLLVLLMIVYTRSSYGYYNTNIVKSVFLDNRLSDFGLRQMKTLEDLYRALNGTFTDSLCQGKDYGGKRLREPGWMDYEMAMLMGVVRLQQIRLAEKVDGMQTLKFDEKNYLPQWKTPNRTLYYMDRYWRIYYPWLSKTYRGVANWLMTITHIGSLYTYSEHNGYVALLARDRRNSEKILNFLKEHYWLDQHTVAVIIDFTLYNVDANIFSLISILVEQTPFGGVIWQLNVQSLALLTNLDQMSFGWWFLLLIYILQLLEFSKVLMLKIWFTGNFLKSPWNCVDLCIVVLNILIFIFLLIREYFARISLSSVETFNKMEYIDFRVATWFDYLATIAMGLLVALTTMRLWKILQFASVFRLFTRTLYTASGSLMATIVGIHIFLFAIGFAAQIVNGSQTEIFSRYIKSLTSIMSFSFGFNSHTSPEDLSHGGNLLGFLLYLILMFVVAIFLINMFITLICDHFAAARIERDQQSVDHLTLGEFLIAEYSYIKEFVERVVMSKFRSKQQVPVKTNIEDKLENLESTLEDKDDILKSKDDLYEADTMRAQRVQQIVKILKLQMNILERQLMLSYLEWESDEEEMFQEEESQI